MRRLIILLLGMFSLCTSAFAETGRWPISNSSENTADVLTSAYGPRDLGSTSYDIHEGVDIRAQSPKPVYPWKSGRVHSPDGGGDGKRNNCEFIRDSALQQGATYAYCRTSNWNQVHAQWHQYPPSY